MCVRTGIIREFRYMVVEYPVRIFNLNEHKRKVVSSINARSNIRYQDRVITFILKIKFNPFKHFKRRLHRLRNAAKSFYNTIIVNIVVIHILHDSAINR